MAFTLCRYRPCPRLDLTNAVFSVRGMAGSGSPFPGQMERHLADTEPAITEIFVDDEGILWVQHSRSGREQPAGILCSYDTFDADGSYLQEVSVASEGDSSYDGLKFLGDGRILLIKGYVLARWASVGAQSVDFGEEESDEPMEIICCRDRWLGRSGMVKAVPRIRGVRKEDARLGSFGARHGVPDVVCAGAACGSCVISARRWPGASSRSGCPCSRRRGRRLGFRKGDSAE